MASQRLFVATIAGKSAIAVEKRLQAWRENAVKPRAVDRFCAALRANATDLQVVYFSEWIDRWLMGNDVPGPGAFEGEAFQLATFTRAEARNRARRFGCRHREQVWFATRLREAAGAWCGPSEHALVLVVREVFGGLATDEEVEAALAVVPDWVEKS